ncbi:lipase member M-like [Hemicordylus capensis]|uniref:lipase member M-like n=1 Tax=Hemicordylus capensis TaxID=884348 RepID=UPI0023043E66|nr:lipase member M-like [Hemicordylus capensis]
MLLFILITLLTLGSVHSERTPRKKREVNPEAFMNISEVIQYQGYPCEEYEILTDDGYYLNTNRIPHGRDNSEKRVSKPAVLVMPGILTNCGTWVANMPNNSLGFILADAGFDVWLANNRGSRWCRLHQNLSYNEEKFWNFSFHEMAMNDLPAIVNFILAKTGQEQIFYIGYSQGSTIGFIAFSAMPLLAQKIKIFFALGPVYLLNHNKSPFSKFAFLAEGLGKTVFGKKEFCIFPNNRTRVFTAHLCDKGFWDKVCSKLVFIAGGISNKNVNVSRMDVFASHLLGCTSTKNILHWVQVIKSREFKSFDYGSENIEKYNQTTPPFYNIKDMKVPVVMWTGSKDLIATPKDTELLLPLLQKLIFYKEIPDWMHYDFVFGLDARRQVYDELVEIISNFP